MSKCNVRFDDCDKEAKWSASSGCCETQTQLVCEDHKADLDTYLEMAKARLIPAMRCVDCGAIFHPDEVKVEPL